MYQNYWLLATIRWGLWFRHCDGENMGKIRLETKNETEIIIAINYIFIIKTKLSLDLIRQQ